MPLSNLVKSFTYANGLKDSAAFTGDYEQSQCQVLNGATPLQSASLSRGDALNITGLGDGVNPSNTQSFAYTPANRLMSATGPYGSKSWTYDGVGNRTSETNTPPGGSAVTDTYTYDSLTNRVQAILRNAQTIRAFTYDAAGNLLTDVRAGSTYAYTYNNANRLKTVSFEGNLKATYTYNGREQLAKRVVTNSGSADGTAYYVYDQWGNLLAELDGAGNTVREYIWLLETEIAPVMDARAQVDRPIAVVSGVNTASPSLLMVHVDHVAWRFGCPLASAPEPPGEDDQRIEGRRVGCGVAAMGRAVSDHGPRGPRRPLPRPMVPARSARIFLACLRQDGQWFQHGADAGGHPKRHVKSGLHHNWHRHYDPSLGRYTQPDPLGFVDGPSVYAYAGGSSVAYVDQDGRWINLAIGAAFGFGMDVVMQLVENGGRWHCVKLGQALGAGALGAIGGGLGGAGLTRYLANLGIKQKGRIGEALSLFEHRLRGSKLLDTQVWSRQYRTYYDGVWRSRTGRVYFSESKFGSAQLRPGQGAAQRGLGEDYVVDRWDYPFFGRVGAYPGGLGGALTTPSHCGC